jgi:hypothetical protein
MDISARAISLTDRPQWTIWVARAGKTDPPSRLILSQTSAGFFPYLAEERCFAPQAVVPEKF